VQIFQILNLKTLIIKSTTDYQAQWWTYRLYSPHA